MIRKNQILRDLACRNSDFFTCVPGITCCHPGLQLRDVTEATIEYTQNRKTQVVSGIYFLGGSA
jgi:hypothetical protein